MLEHKIIFFRLTGDICAHWKILDRCVFFCWECLSTFVLTSSGGIFSWQKKEKYIPDMVFICLLWSCTQWSALKKCVFRCRNKMQLKYCLFMAQGKAILETNTQAISSCCDRVLFIWLYTSKDKFIDLWSNLVLSVNILIEVALCHNYLLYFRSGLWSISHCFTMILYSCISDTLNC